MQVVKTSEFKAKCLALLDQVAATGEAVLITKNGKPVAELCAVAGARPKSPFGLHKGTTTAVGDILAPIDVEREALQRFFSTRMRWCGWTRTLLRLAPKHATWCSRHGMRSN